MSKCLIVAEVSNGKVKTGALELLSECQKSSKEAEVVVFGESNGDIAAQVGGLGGKVVHNLGSLAGDYNPESFSLGLAKAIEASGAEWVLGTASALTRDLFPRVAAHFSAAVASDCTELDLAAGKVAKPLYAGKCFAEVDFHSDKKFVLMRPNQLPVSEAGSGSAEANALDFAAGDLKSKVLEVVKGASEKLDLTEANIIVSGGRGLKEADNFKLLHELADVLGATVGASRAVVDSGWVGHDMQVGQTGKTVAPSLYIAVGISGAIQHLAGMSGSKVIVAINNDAEAPIFQKATYGIVGDLFEVMPMLTEEFKKVVTQ